MLIGGFHAPIHLLNLLVNGALQSNDRFDSNVLLRFVFFASYLSDSK